ncbi:MAG TPA: hypothetical protein VGL68_06280 [Solirubrobacteraceae bacterium]|jgi:hypothetical protein
MARKPSEPSPKSTGSRTVDDDRPAKQPAAERSQVAGEAQAAGESRFRAEPQATDEPAGPDETAGPLMLTRLRKTDGRALILYTAAGDGA